MSSISREYYIERRGYGTRASHGHTDGERYLGLSAVSIILSLYSLRWLETPSMGKRAVVLDYHRTIFVNRSTTNIGPSKLKNIQ